MDVSENETQTAADAENKKTQRAVPVLNRPFMQIQKLLQNFQGCKNLQTLFFLFIKTNAKTFVQRNEKAAELKQNR